MKQIWPNYSYSPTTNVLTLTGLNIDRDQLLLESAPERGRIMYNFADSTVTASAFTAGANTGLTLVASTAGLTTTAALVIYYDDQVGGISGTVTAAVLAYDESNDDLGELRSYSIGSRGGALQIVGPSYAGAVTANTLPCVPIFGSVTIGSALPAGTNSIGVVTIGAGTVTIGAGTAQIGTVTANTFAVQGTAVTTSNFTSTTASTVLASFNATREVLTIFNEGAGNLHICAGATCTTIAYQVRLSSGDYYEVPNHQTTITHSAVFAAAGTARVTQVS